MIKIIDILSNFLKNEFHQLKTFQTNLWIACSLLHKNTCFCFLICFTGPKRIISYEYLQSFSIWMIDGFDSSHRNFLKSKQMELILHAKFFPIVGNAGFFFHRFCGFENNRISEILSLGEKSLSLAKILSFSWGKFGISLEFRRKILILG